MRNTKIEGYEGNSLRSLIHSLRLELMNHLEGYVRGMRSPGVLRLSLAILEPDSQTPQCQPQLAINPPLRRAVC